MSIAYRLSVWRSNGATPRHSEHRFQDLRRTRSATDVVPAGLSVVLVGDALQADTPSSADLVFDVIRELAPLRSPKRLVSGSGP